VRPVTVSIDFAESEYARGRAEGAAKERRRIRRALLWGARYARDALDLVEAIDRATRAPKRRRGKE
jgi:hypothetical protein